MVLHHFVVAAISFVVGRESSLDEDVGQHVEPNARSWSFSGNAPAVPPIVLLTRAVQLPSAIVGVQRSAGVDGTS